MHRFYAPDIASDGILPEEESRHVVRVLRLSEGDEVEVVDGRGTLYTCRVALAHAKHCHLNIEATRHVPPHWGRRIVLGVAPTKNMDRLEWVVEKATELGVDRVVPLLCEHSERRVLKTERLHKIAVAAMKQSLKATLPRIDELTPLSRLVAEPFEGDRFVAYCDEALPREQRLELARVISADRDTMVLIGPEGDFSPAEVERLLAAGFKPVTLGQSRLRTETAALMAVATAHVVTSAKFCHVSKEA